MSKRVFAVTISAFVAGALAYTVSTTKPYVSPTASMEPTVQAGDHMLVKKMSGAPKRGGLVWFHPPTGPKQHFLKRVVGVPGDHIRFVNKAVYLNGKPLDEPYAVHKTDFTDPYRDNFPGR